jgi:hypothetical protein
LGKLIDEEQPQKIEKCQNLPKEEDSLNIELIINLVEKLKEYLIQKTPPSNLLNDKIHLNLRIQLNPKQFSYITCDLNCDPIMDSYTQKGVKYCLTDKICQFIF